MTWRSVLSSLFVGIFAYLLAFLFVDIIKVDMTLVLAFTFIALYQVSKVATRTEYLKQAVELLYIVKPPPREEDDIES